MDQTSTPTNKVLVGIPYHERKRYALDPLMDWLRDADLPDTEILMRVQREPYGKPEALKVQRNFFRTYALEHDFTHLLFIGVDTIPPLDVLPALLAHDVDVVGGIYYGRNQATNGNPLTAVAWKHSQPTFNSKEYLEQQTGLLEVDGMGMDCVLFSRKALENFDWTYKVNDDDYPVYNQLKDKGFTIYLDSTVVCKHYNDVNQYS